MRKNWFPDSIPRRLVGGHLLYAPVVTVGLGETTLVMVSGLLARDRDGNVVGAGDMRAQIEQVGENLRACLESVGAGLGDLIRTCTFVTAIDEFFRHADTRHRYFGPALPTSTTVEVTRLSDPRFMVEVEAFAIVPTSCIPIDQATAT